MGSLRTLKLARRSSRGLALAAWLAACGNVALAEDGPGADARSAKVDDAVVQAAKGPTEDGIPLLKTRRRTPVGADEAGSPEEKGFWDYVSLLPIIFYTPETDLGLGAGGLVQWDMPGSTVDRRPSSVAAAVIYTTRKQLVTQVVPELRFGHDTFVLRTDLTYFDFPDRFFGVGNNNSCPGPTLSGDCYENYADRYWMFVPEMRWRPWSHLYLGAHHRLRVGELSRTDEDGVLAGEQIFGTGHTVASGAGPLVEWDTRDGLYWPLKGQYAQLKATFFRSWLGSDYDAEMIELDLRHYQPLWPNHWIVFRGVFQTTTGEEPPFQLMHRLGGSKMFRGWYDGQLRDRALMVLQSEYRWALTSRWAVTGFGNLGRVAPRAVDLSPKGLRGSGGLGVRFAVLEEDRTNIRLDVAYGDSFSFYLQFREAY